MTPQFYRVTRWLTNPDDIIPWKRWFDSLKRRNEVRKRSGKTFALFVEMPQVVPKKPEMKIPISHSEWTRDGHRLYYTCESHVRGRGDLRLARTWGIVFTGNALTLRRRQEEERQRIEIDLVRTIKSIKRPLANIKDGVL